MAIPEFTKSITIRVPDDVRAVLDFLSQEERQPLSRVVRAVILEGLEKRMSTNPQLQWSLSACAQPPAAE